MREKVSRKGKDTWRLTDMGFDLVVSSDIPRRIFQLETLKFVLYKSVPSFSLFSLFLFPLQSILLRSNNNTLSC